ncbi:hypothetical protein V500_04327 [Pseudogymnoascus sp. VKM F-4518 (FW-2643)]|nr:hypothetical protein V500_04327 [Pseudogymnoascus sp. VKM F-4518 (FW-2643)]
MLYSVLAAQVPTQSSPDLIVFSKACTSVPNVVPTASNPMGEKPNSNSRTGSNGATGSGNGNPNSGTATLGASAGSRKLVVRNQCGVAPTGPSNNNVAPISTPVNIDTLPACLAACKVAPSCQSFKFGSTTAPNGLRPCRLFDVPASTVPAPVKGQNFVVYDVACSV